MKPTYHIHGMSCNGCSHPVEETLSKVEGGACGCGKPGRSRGHYRDGGSYPYRKGLKPFLKGDLHDKMDSMTKQTR